MLRTAGKIAFRFFISILTVLLLAVIAILTLIWVLVKGPSPTAQRLFVTSVRETSAVGWLANIYLSEDEIIGMLSAPASDIISEDTGTDTSLITLPNGGRPRGSAAPDDPNYVPGDTQPGEQPPADDGDGMELVEVFGVGYRGYMLIVDDPLRVFVGTPTNYGGSGVTLADMIERTGAVAGINGGGFDDPDGTGSGGVPDGLVITDGELKWGSGSTRLSVIGFDADGILHVGLMTPAEAVDLGLQWAVSFGPALIQNGVAASREALRSGINPRTAIGQRADGAVLMLVVDGRQVDSMGATYGDLAEIFLDFGAVNAANLDGGSSTLMIIDGEFVNTCASIAGPRRLPNAFLVRPIDDGDN